MDTLASSDIKVKCVRSTCSSNEIFTESFDAIGDESGIVTYVCAKCGYRWVSAG